MGIQRLTAAVCALTGIGLLAGPAWSLLAAAVLLFFAPTPERVRSAAGRMRGIGIRVGRWLASGRQAVAAASMPAAIVAVAVGLGLALGPGWGVAAAGLVVGGLALQVDRAG
jgi:hypothetical protein